MTLAPRHGRKRHRETNVIPAILFLSIMAAVTGSAVERTWPCHVIDDSSRGADGPGTATVLSHAGQRPV